MRNDSHRIPAEFTLKMLGNSRLAWLVFLAGMALTGVVWYAVATWEEDKAHKEFTIHANDTLYTVRQRLAVYGGILHGARGLFAASEMVTRDEWRRYSAMAGLDIPRSGVHSLAFIRYVAAHEKAGFEKRMSRDAGTNMAGNSGFAIFPSGERDGYFPIEYIEPESSNRDLLGLDRGAEADTRRTLERARDSGQLAASGLLRSMVEKPDSSRYFLMVLPIYRNDSDPSSLTERRAALTGFVAARVEMSALLKEVAVSGAWEELFFELYDGGSDAQQNAGMKPENLLYAVDGDDNLHAQTVAAGRFTYQAEIDVAGRNWLFFFGSRPGFSAVGGYLPVVVLLGGVVTSALMFALVLMLVAQRQRVMADVIRQKSLFSQVLDALPVNVFLKDKNFRFVLVNEEAARTLGMSKEAATGKSNFDVFPREIAARLLEYDQYVFAEERLVMREERVICNRQERTLLAGKKVIRLPGSDEPMLLGFSFDISDRKKAERELKHEKSFIRQVIDNIPSIIFVKDEKGDFLLVNHSTTSSWGMTPEQLVGRNQADIFQSNRKVDFISQVERLVMDERKSIDMEESLSLPNGETLWMSMSKRPLPQADGRLFMLCIASDITEHRRLEQEAARAHANELSRSLTDAVGEGLIGVDLSHRIVFANPKAQEILAIPEAEMQGNKLDDVVQAITADGSVLTDGTCPAWRMLAEGQTFQVDDWSFRRGDGSHFPVNVVIAPIYENDNMSGAVLSFQDITRRKQVEEAVRRLERQQKAILDNLPDMAWLKDEESNYIIVNEALARTSGMTAAGMVGRSDLEFWPEDIARMYRADDREVMESRLTKRIEEPFVGRDGKRSWIETIKSPIFNDAGKVIGTVGTARDITVRHEAEAMQTQHMVELARVNAELDEFTYVASHDLQEPVRKLVAFSEWLKKDLGNELPPRAEQDLGFIVDAAQRMQRLVADLLALSRTGKVSMVREEVSLDDAANRALEVLELRIAECGATIRRTPLPTVWGDLTLLAQLYQNLIGNALKFTGEAPAEISLTAQQVNNEWIFGVRDNGIGIPGQYADQVFQPFKRLHGRGQFEGSGVGLSICRKVVERHHGRIWVESEEGQGAWFKFTLGQ